MKKCFVFLTIALVAFLCVCPLLHAFVHTEKDCDFCEFLSIVKSCCLLAFVSFVVLSVGCGTIDKTALRKKIIAGSVSFRLNC